MKKKVLITVCAFVLVAALAVAGTVAYLTDSAAVTNTFTVGNIDIELAETATDFKMVPGTDIAKDPQLTVKANSEACWLFVEFTESANLDDFITYDVAAGWTKLADVDNVYYRAQTATTADVIYDVLSTKDGYANGFVTVKSDVTKAMMDALSSTNQPKLTFTAYAVQQAGFATAADAWKEAGK